jgi:hypothetical protein
MMAKSAKKTERKLKLKVLRTPIGFHDAYVAAPSQKAALEAWGADSNIFAQGIAEQVTDPAQMEEALANPGKVIKKVRGSADEHFAELERTPARRKAARSDGASAEVVILKPKSKPKPKPSRDELDAAEEALEKADRKQRKALRKIDEKIQALDRECRELQRRNETERDRLTDRRDRAKAVYDGAMQKWRDG